MWLFHLHNIVKIMAFTLIFSLMALWLGDFIGIIACGCFISTVRWKIQPFFQFSPWRNPRLRHFSGYPFGTSRKKTSIFFYNTAILLVTPLEFRKSAGHFLMARPSKTSGKRMLPLRAITQKSRSRGRGIYVPDVVSGTTAPEEAVPVHTISRLLSTPCRE